MVHTNDSFATMLLTMALSANREEYARPYSTQEFVRLEECVRMSDLRTIGSLMGMDISSLMIRLGISEEEGYRIYTLLNRRVQLGYTVEKLMLQGIDVITIHNEGYAERLKRRMGNYAPPFLYRFGNMELLKRPAISIVGIDSVKTTPEVREGVLALVKDATRNGFSVITGGELGVARVASNAVLECGGYLIDVIAGGMHEHIASENVQALHAEGRIAVLSLEHPEAMFTISHAIVRNKVIFALSDAAFICNTDGKRGETDALHNRFCDWIYAWSGFAANGSLISKGAIPLNDLRNLDFDALYKHWQSSQSEQLDMFDIL